MPPYQCELCRLLCFSCDCLDLVARSKSPVNQDPTQIDVINEYHSTSEEYEVMMQYLTDPRFSAIDTHSQPMSTLHQSEPVDDALDLMYGTEDIAAELVPHVHSVNEYFGPDAKLMNTPEPQLTPPPTTTPCHTALCRWRDKGAPNICGEVISCEDVPIHFKIHGIDNIHESDLVDCMWENCFVQRGRKNYVRHVRECHLHHIRKKGWAPSHADHI